LRLPYTGSVAVLGDTGTDETLTPLQIALDIRNITAAAVERKLREVLAGRAPSRQQLGRWRLGSVDIRRKDMVRILWAVRQVAQDETIQLGELFAIDPSADEIWRD